MAENTGYDPDSVTQFLNDVANKLDIVGQKATQGAWIRSQTHGWMHDETGATLATAVHRNNIRIIVASSPNTIYKVAELLRAAAATPPDDGDVVRRAAVDLALEYDTVMKLKSAQTLQSVAA